MTFGLLDRERQTTPGIAAPRVTLNFGGGNGGALSGLGPDIGPFGAAEGLETGLLSLDLRRGFAPAVDWADVHLKLPPGGPSLPALGDTGSIGISVADRSIDFAAQVDRIEHRTDGSVRLGLGNGGRKLAQARSTTAFAESKPADVISGLCAEAGVDASPGGGGETLYLYVADGSRSVFDHIAQLAASMGRLACFDPSSTLVLIDDSSAGEEIPISIGDAIADAHLSERIPAGGIRVTGAGASDNAWLRKDAGPIQAEAGASSPVLDNQAPWLRSASGVQTLAAARGRALARASGSGRLLLVAYPDAEPGALLALSGTALDGTWRVMSSRIRFDATEGFNNTVEIARAGAEAEAGALGLLGGFL